MKVEINHLTKVIQGKVCKLELPLPGFKSSVSRRRVC